MTTQQVWHGHKKCAINGAKVPKANQKLGEPCPFCGNIMGAYLGDTAAPLSPQATSATAASTATAPEEVSPDARLAQLERLHADGLLTDAEYASKRQQIIDDL